MKRAVRGHCGRVQGTSYFQLLNPMVMAIFAIGFALIWRNDRAFRASLYMATGYTCGAIGFILDFAVRDASGPYLGQYVSNVWFLATPLLVTAAIANWLGRRVPWRRLMAVYSAVFVLVSVFLFVWPHHSVRAMIMNGGTGLLLGLSLGYLWQARQQPLKRLIFWISAFSTIQFFVRPALVIAYSGLGTEQVSYSNSVYALTLHFTSGICAIALAASILFAMAMELVERLDNERATDPMSGLLNRRGFDLVYEQLASQCSRDNRPLSLIVADIDHFKSVNDRYGHKAGDEVICAFAALLESECRDGDTCVRLGGEEFAVLVSSGDIAAAWRLAERLRERLAATSYRGLPPGERCTASFGICYARATDSFDTVFARADEALYSAKDQGRNKTVCADLPAFNRKLSTRVVQVESPIAA